MNAETLNRGAPVIPHLPSGLEETGKDPANNRTEAE